MHCQQSQGFENAAELLECELKKEDYTEINIKIKDRSFIRKALKDLQGLQQQSDDGSNIQSQPSPSPPVPTNATPPSSGSGGGDAGDDSDAFLSSRLLQRWRGMPLEEAVAEVQQQFQRHFDAAVAADPPRQLEVHDMQRQMQQALDAVAAGRQ